MKYSVLFCCLALVTIFTSCKEEWVRNIEFDKEKFAIERAKWQEVKPLKYSFVYETFVSMPSDPVEITILNDSMVSAEYSETSHGHPDEVYWYKKEFIAKIDDIYAYIESEFNKDNSDDDVVLISLKITYNAGWHFPEKVRYSFSKKSESTGAGGSTPPGKYNGYSMDIRNFINLTL
ncbi:MAG: DUF6174 domain-containing protein [Spirochaetaceae bacterium]|jgi:hypothetical protein|nr:DUF6174 domain-containing protein [Spirochaetaceae bacterium]